MPIPTNGWIMLMDESKCIACRACQIACQQWNSLPAEDTDMDHGTYKNPLDMSGANLTVVKFSEHHKPSPTPRTEFLFFVDRCRHCETPYCKGACPLGAIKRYSSVGIVYIDENLCDPNICYVGGPESSRPCQMACPYDIPRWAYKKNGTQYADVMKKCNFCHDRFRDPVLKGVYDPPSAQDGGRFRGRHARSNVPACVLACPTGAITLGPAPKQKRRAYRRGRWLRSHGYRKASIYSGRPISGGTHVIWLLKWGKSLYQDTTINF